MAKRLARLLLLSAALLAVRAQDDDVADEVEAAPAAAAPSPAVLVLAKASAPGQPRRRRADASRAPQTVKEAPAVVGGNVTVTLQVFNAGERCARGTNPGLPRHARGSRRRCAAWRLGASRSRGATQRCARRTRAALPGERRTCARRRRTRAWYGRTLRARRRRRPWPQTRPP
jgi:hypothetical protein